MVAVCTQGQWYFKLTPENWVCIGPKLSDARVILRSLGIATGP